MTTNPVAEQTQAAPQPVKPAKRISVIQDRNSATFAHFSGIMGVVPPALVYYLKRKNAPFTEQESLAAVNFTLIPSIAIAVCIVLSIFMPDAASGLMLAAALVWIFMAIGAMRAGVHVNSGNPYRYRFVVRLFH